jgi:hypothetical protein
LHGYQTPRWARIAGKPTAIRFGTSRKKEPPEKNIEISPLFKVNPSVVLNVGWIRDGKLNVGRIVERPKRRRKAA